MFRNTFLTGFCGYAITNEGGGHEDGHGNETGARAEAPEERRTGDRALDGVRGCWSIHRSLWRPSELRRAEQGPAPHGQRPGRGRTSPGQDVRRPGEKDHGTRKRGKAR